MTDFRTELEKLMRATIADHQNWTYHEVRPMPVPASWHKGERIQGDCSKGVQYLCKWVGAPDPMKNGYGVWGNSYTLWLNLQHLPHASQLLVGDIVTFGHDGDQHAAMVMEAGNDPLLWSFGHQGAPDSYRLSQDGRPAQFLRNPLPKYVPTKVEVLKARTGWFAWMAWYQGEGDWHGYGARNSQVRPKVPHVIPPTWWARRIKFLRNRNKGNKATK